MMEQTVPIHEGRTEHRGAESQTERRANRRLEMRLPLEALALDASTPTAIRATTRNVSSSGVYFEACPNTLREGSEVRLTLSIPPGVGYSPFAGRVTGTASVVRIEGPLSSPAAEQRFGIAARFSQPLRCLF